MKKKEEKKKEKKKKKKKKEEVPSTGVELANFDFIVSWFHPLRYSGMNWGIAFKLPFCTSPNFCRLIRGTYVQVLVSTYLVS